MDAETWTRCSSCKEAIAFGATYYACSVSTCNRKRTAMVFCSVSCWEAHLPMMRHRDAAAVEQEAPASAEDDVERSGAGESASAARRVVRPSAEPAPSDAGEDDVPRDVLVVISKLKKYVRARSGMNTSDSVTDVLSEHIRRICDEAIRNAGRDGRRTVLDRDVPPPPGER